MYLVRMIYASRFSEGVGPDDIQSILEVSRRKNEKSNITGALCYSPGMFLQCLEGSRKAVNELYNKIINDSRHHDVIVLEYSEIHQRAFSKWSMAYVKATELSESLLLEYSSKKEFDPYTMSAKQALGLVLAMAELREKTFEETLEIESKKE